MKKRIIWNDLKANKLLSFSTWIFMAVCAFLFALTCLLFSGLLGSIDVLMEQARTPDFVQMHAGEIEPDSIEQFAGERGEVENFQILTFLNLENAGIWLGEASLADSTQDNGVIVQSELFDYLVDLDNQIIETRPGEVYVPVCYRQMYDSGQAGKGLRVGDRAQLGGVTFTIAGFLRDSQMNSMMSSSKRFLVCEEDYEKLKSSGTEEYLIEFLLKPGADVDAFATAYADAGQPANGPAITRPLIKMVNALSDGMLALVILLVSVVMLMISMLCIRFTLLDKLTSDRREIGMLKAVGVSRQDIRQLYFLKYLLLSVLGAVCGLIAAFLVKGPLQAGMQELYGMAENGTATLAVSVLGAALTEAVLLVSVGRTLRRMERMSAVEALNGRDSTDTGKRSYLLVLLVIAAGVFLMAVPRNLHSTISSEKFVTYMGIGEGEIRMDIRQTEDIYGKTRRTESMLAEDSRVKETVSLLTKSYRVCLPDGSRTNLNVEQGDHEVFPVSYVEGHAPRENAEIALSYLCAREFKLETGDQVELEIEGTARKFNVCGIYSDITNGGKTAKSVFIDDSAAVMWSVFYISLAEGVSREQWILAWDEILREEQINFKLVDIREFMLATYGQTMQQIGRASAIAIVAALAVMCIVVFLFTRLMMAKDRNDISLKMALGFTSGEIRRFYVRRYFYTACAGIVAGILAGVILGESIAGMMLNALGAAGFQFVVNGPAVYLGIPAFTLAAVLLSVLGGLKALGEIRAYECCMGNV